MRRSRAGMTNRFVLKPLWPPVCPGECAIGIVRALAVPDASFTWPSLAKSYRDQPGTICRWRPLAILSSGPLAD